MLIEDLASHVLDTKYEVFNDEVIEAAKKRLIDIAGCTLSGANASGNAALLDVIRGWGGTQEATILVHGDKVPLPHAAMMNSLMARSFDYEVTGPEIEGANIGQIAGHVCSTTDCTAISTAEYTGASGKELIAAIILGGDLAARIASAQDFSFASNFELCGTVNAFGATAIAGRLLGLNKDQLVNAFGILVNQLSGSFQSIWDGAHSFKLIGAMAARNGIFSVQLAQKGFTGLKDPLFSPLGYFPLFCKNYLPENITVNLGKVFYCKGHHKIHPSCYGCHTALECSLDILLQGDINADEITEINLIVHPGRENSFINRPFGIESSQPDSLFNLYYAVANVLLRKGARLEHYTDEYIHDPAVLELVKKIKIIPTLQTKQVQACRLHVTMKNGKTYSSHKEFPRGVSEDPLTKEEIKDKFRGNVTFSEALSINDVEKVLETLDNIDKVGNVKDIVKLLVT